MTGKHQRARLLRNLPANWNDLFAPVPGTRTGRIRCLLCGADGMPPLTPRDVIGFDGRLHKARPNPWQLSCIAGHTARCEACERPFRDATALSGHQRCKSGHDCCTEHTSVPAWKNPFRVIERNTA